MIELRDLAADLADKYDTDTAAMLEAVTTYAGQISDDSDLWDADAEELTEAGEEIVRGSVAAWQGDDRAIDALTELGDAQADVDKHDEQIARRDAAIREAIKDLVPVAQIAEMTRLSRGRIYQIRDRRR